MRRLIYFIREALFNIRFNRTSTLIAVGTTGFTLACFGIFLLLYLNLKGMVSSLQEDIQVILYLEEDISTRGVSDLSQRLRKEPEVASLSFISKEAALQEFRKQFPSEKDLLDGLGGNPLPASLVVALAPQFRSPDSIRRWAERQGSVPGIEEVQYSQDWIENLEVIVGYLELAAMGIGALLAAASVTIIASTIRLTVYARRAEIEIMRMVGATGTFVKIPYLLEGAVLGALGGLLSLALLKGCFELFSAHLGASGRLLGLDASFTFFPAQVSALLVLAGLLLGSAGSFVSLLRIGRAES